MWAASSRTVQAGQAGITVILCSPPGSARKSSATCSPCARTSTARSEVSSRLFAFYDWCARADVPEVTTLAKTIEVW